MRILWGMLCVVMVYAVETLPVSAEIIRIDSQNLIFKAGSFKVGQTGIVLTEKRDDKGTHNVIIANAVIESIKGNEAKARYFQFETITQKYLPTPQIAPSKGDKVVFGSFYNKSIVIAPDQESYNKILSSQPQMSFAHIDLFEAFLAKDGINDPKPKELKKFCNVYSIGLVYILASNGVNIIDCQSFQILEVLPFDIDSVHESKGPFFSRMPDIDTGSLMSKLRPNKSRHYFSYYDDLIRIPLDSFIKRSKGDQ